jgi:integrase
MTFEDWLLQNHFAATTTRKALGHLRSVERAVEQSLPIPEDSNARLTLRRYLSYAGEVGLEDDLTRAAAFYELKPLTRLPKAPAPKRKKERRSFTEENWEQLMYAVADSDDPRDQVIWAMGLTGLRVGDVLRVEEDALGRGLRSGTLELVRKGDNRTPIALAIPTPWQLLHKGMRRADAWNVATYVTEGGSGNPEADGAAYKRVRRRLKTLGKQLGIEGDIYTHRLRRTFMVHALEHTDNIKTVQDAVAHKSINSTLGYVDEVNVRKSGRLQRELAGLPPEEES